MIPVHFKEIVEAPLLETAVGWIGNPRHSQNINLFYFLQISGLGKTFFRHYK